MQFERFTIDDSDYPRRPENIPDDYYWDWEMHAWFPPGGPVDPDPEAVRAYEDAEWERKREEYRRSHPSAALSSGNDLPRSHLITVDELRAAGVIRVPPSRRKPRGAGAERGQLPLFGDDETEPTNKETTPRDPDGDEPSE